MSNKRIIVAMAILVIVITSSVFGGEENIKSLYDAAIKYFSSGKYTLAIHCWQRILEIDSSQIPPKKMIEFARQKMKSEIAPLEKTFNGFVENGQWKRAAEIAQKILDMDPTHPKIKRSKEKIEKILKFFSSAKKAGKVSRFLKIAVKAYIEDKPGIVLDAMIYAKQINTDSKVDSQISGLLSFFEGLYPEERGKIKLIAGMNLISQLLQSALDSIYKADYTGAIVSCDRVLAIDPKNVMALMRKGSAYYALKKFSQAKKNWKMVLKIDPKNRDVKKFLRSLEKYESRRKK